MTIFNHQSASLLWPQKGSLMKTQTCILENRLYYTRKIVLHRKGKKSRTVRITPILICGIWWPPHPTSMRGTGPFFWRVRAQGRRPHEPDISKNACGPVGIPLLKGTSGAGWSTQPHKGGKSLGKAPLSPKEISRYRDTLGQICAADNPAGRSATRNWRGADRDWSAVFVARPTQRASVA